MPGKITRINVAIGDMVNAGDVIVVMEAMKMEHPLVAPYKGVITDLYYSVGDVITKDGTTVFVVQNDENDSVAA
jgi:acetyl/propionyl-CoA carboxylase alpha subunit